MAAMETGDRWAPETLQVVLPIVEGLAACGGDIRPVLDAQFRMSAWIQRRLPPQ